jgi:hypothetical protein
VDTSTTSIAWRISGACSQDRSDRFGDAMLLGLIRFRFAALQLGPVGEVVGGRKQVTAVFPGSAKVGSK